MAIQTRTKLGIAFGFLVASWSPTAYCKPATRVHPLDPLTKPEIATVVTVLKSTGKISRETRFATIYLKEPPKSQVRADIAEGHAHRAGFASLYNWANGVASEAVVDLERRTVVSWNDLQPDDPPQRHITIERVDEIVRADGRWQAVAQKRGFKDLSQVAILARVGELRKLEQRNGDRFVGAIFFLRNEASAAPFIPGLNVEVNLTKGQVSKFEEMPLAQPTPNDANVKSSGSTDNRKPKLRKLQIVQPEGASFEIDGSEVRWQNWRLHYGVHPRRGLELFDIAYEDGGRLRPVLYRASVSEMIAPYGDPSFGTWYPRDEGDYGLASYSKTSASPQADAPANAVFASAVVADDRGAPVDIPRAVAIYERDAGLLWRHGSQARRARKLVLSSYATIDNYDYAFNWIFGQDGSIEVEVMLTGLMNFRNTPQKNDDGATHLDHPMFGHLVADGVDAPNHQHFFSFRLDFDIDGPQNNTVLELNTESVLVGDNNPRGEWFSMTEHPLRTEQEAQRNLNLATSRKWKIVNMKTTNGLGQLTGYTLMPGENSIPFAAPESDARLKAGFINAHLWVTAYSPDEMFASGEYVNLGHKQEGLPAWTKANRSVDGQDIVVWYTLGITHIPRTEDWPLMPVHPAGFRLVPSNFFSDNPALDDK
jgi:primary-amine oxidase